MHIYHSRVPFPNLTQKIIFINVKHRCETNLDKTIITPFFVHHEFICLTVSHAIPEQFVCGIAFFHKSYPNA